MELLKQIGPILVAIVFAIWLVCVWPEGKQHPTDSDDDRG